MAKRQYIIYSDESDRKGPLFSNFFGGVLILAQDREPITDLLNEKRVELNLTGEIKWQRVTENYCEKYIEFMKYYFSFVSTGRIRVRIMFSQNLHLPVGLTDEQKEMEYFLLYYQFIKHAFGIKYCNPNLIDSVYFSILADQIPDTQAKVDAFKDNVSRIPHRRGMDAYNVFIPRHQIADVDSRDHVILQELDVILGAMSSKLNGKLRQKPDGARKRGKRTIAKERLYKVINAEIRKIYPSFNVGSSTGTPNGPIDRWHHPYRHWIFVPKNFSVNDDYKKKVTAPPSPTE